VKDDTDTSTIVIEVVFGLELIDKLLPFLHETEVVVVEIMGCKEQPFETLLEDAVVEFQEKCASIFVVFNAPSIDRKSITGQTCFVRIVNVAFLHSRAVQFA
jgi:hypothetical protein